MLTWIEWPPFMGIRETRRLLGEYTLTEQDIFDCARFDDVITAGRDISATHLALASVRVMGLAMCLGEAAGKAAALAVRDKKELRDLDVKELQSALRKEGVWFRD